MARFLRSIVCLSTQGACSQLADFDQLEAEIANAVESTVQRGLVRERAAENRAAIGNLHREAGKRVTDGRAGLSAQGDLVLRQQNRLLVGAHHRHQTTKAGERASPARVNFRTHSSPVEDFRTYVRL